MVDFPQTSTRLDRLSQVLHHIIARRLGFPGCFNYTKSIAWSNNNKSSIEFKRNLEASLTLIIPTPESFRNIIHSHSHLTLTLLSPSHPRHRRTLSTCLPTSYLLDLPTTTYLPIYQPTNPLSIDLILFIFLSLPLLLLTIKIHQPLEFISTSKIKTQKWQLSQHQLANKLTCQPFLSHLKVPAIQMKTQNLLQMVNK
ncbi:hypothetical protein EYC84_006530 [Monilinia fructicola]|uniref:Uncharacterized protein n=1 Tax=Monilinia fructicola TaxID=38448 RepID=A0A5M9K8L4_MONFR|nr:hypothetical protein EYC84_006530 [Monilinia fructicola]